MNATEPNISVTRTDYTVDTRAIGAEEHVSEISVTARAVARMAEKIRLDIQGGRFSNSRDPVERPPCSPKVKLSENAGGTNPIWFIGDLHGDLVALRTLTMFARKQNRCDGIALPTRLCFLGDFVDDAPFSAEVVAWIIRNSPLRLGGLGQGLKTYDVSAVAGNHDDGLFYSDTEDNGHFASTVSPSSFAEELNAHLKAGEAWRSFGRHAIDFFQRLPRMIVFNQSLMVAHGGVPHSDVPITERSDLESPQALSDFVWNRLHESAQKKFPNRESRGSQQGVRDFDSFIAKLAGMPDICATPKVFVRGHDHHESNFKLYDAYKGCAVMTLNAFTVNRDCFGAKYRDLAMLRWTPSRANTIEIFRFKFKEGSLEQIWAVLTQNSTPASTK